MTAADPLGRDAVSPWGMGRAAWWSVTKRVWREIGRDNIGLISAGVAFYGFLSVVPTLAAIILIYGLFASPDILLETLRAVSRHLPSEAATIVNDQLIGLAQSPDERKGWGLAVAISLAVYGATKGVDALVTAISLAYGETDCRGFFGRSLTVLALTLFGVTFALGSLAILGLLSLPVALLPNGVFDMTWVIGVVSMSVLAVASSFGAAIFFRFAPDRHAARWTWLTPGAVLTGLGWVTVTSGFSFYTSRVADYGAAWGSLAGIVVLMTWLYLSAYILLIGAELNAELERQTVRDTTTGPDKPMGSRGAVVADTVASPPLPETSG